MHVAPPLQVASLAALLSFASAACLPEPGRPSPAAPGGQGGGDPTGEEPTDGVPAPGGGGSDGDAGGGGGDDAGAADDDSAPGGDVDGDGDGSPRSEDCDDSDPSVFPGAPDRCDGVLDNDCDGRTDPGESDGDRDGFTPCGGDCSDVDPAARPDQTAHYSVARADGSFDWDCDGVETWRWADTWTVGLCPDGCDGEVQGWAAYPPACGTPSAWFEGCVAEVQDDSSAVACRAASVLGKLQECR